LTWEPLAMGTLKNLSQAVYKLRKLKYHHHHQSFNPKIG
jgi:hypothetical protein